ncbi:coatomer subunit zeta [Nematocida major]|uniref:coatomer subunit zeta n=1 Tax=Nematocida major TaxID=1912982 RepID=UPI0020081CB7|nr:coatomer subunit zeta [Nematocida major]KAH9385625.1 coatomer subunit zeta [Nematocida major]
MCTSEVVQGLAIIGENGRRLIGSPLTISKAEEDMEKRMFEKAKEADDSIILFEDRVVLYKIVGDICIMLYASINENEIALSNALDAFYTAAIKTINGPLTQKSVEKHYDEMFLLIDAFIYKTLIVTDSSADLAASIHTRTFEGLESIQMPSKLSSALKKAQKSFASSWFRK